VRAEAKSGPEDDFVEHGRARVDDELAAFGGFDDAAQVASVHFRDGDRAFLAEEAAGADGVAVAAPDSVPLSVEKLCEERAGRPRSQNEDPHGVKETLSQEGLRPSAGWGRVFAVTMAGEARKGLSKWQSFERHCIGRSSQAAHNQTRENLNAIFAIALRR
jgi:hypothetical protein